MDSKINFHVKLDEERVPEMIAWEASDSGMTGVKPCNAVMMSIWDPKEKAKNTALARQYCRGHLSQESAGNQ